MLIMSNPCSARCFAPCPFEQKIAVHFPAFLAAFLIFAIACSTSGCQFTPSGMCPREMERSKGLRKRGVSVRGRGKKQGLVAPDKEHIDTLNLRNLLHVLDRLPRLDLHDRQQVRIRLLQVLDPGDPTERGGRERGPEAANSLRTELCGSDDCGGLLGGVAERDDYAVGAGVCGRDREGCIE
jgi:hypothetical protein